MPMVVSGGESSAGSAIRALGVRMELQRSVSAPVPEPRSGVCWPKTWPGDTVMLVWDSSGVPTLRDGRCALEASWVVVVAELVLPLVVAWFELPLEPLPPPPPLMVLVLLVPPLPLPLARPLAVMLAPLCAKPVLVLPGAGPVDETDEPEDPDMDRWMVLVLGAGRAEPAETLTLRPLAPIQMRPGSPLEALDDVRPVRRDTM